MKIGGDIEEIRRPSFFMAHPLDRLLLTDSYDHGHLLLTETFLDDAAREQLQERDTQTQFSMLNQNLMFPRL